MATTLERPSPASSVSQAERREGSAAFLHRRQRGRRQVHAHRPPALRFQRRLRRPARVACARPRPIEPPAAARFRAADRRPARRTRAGHHDRRRLPLFLHAQAQVHHRRHARATSSTRATWPPALHRRPRHHPDRRAQRRAAAIAPACCIIATLLGIRHIVVADQQDGPGGFRRGGLRRRSAPSSLSFATRLADRRADSSPSARCDGDNVVDAQPAHALVRGARRCSSIWKREVARDRAVRLHARFPCST